jgi:hypothetical protein
LQLVSIGIAEKRFHLLKALQHAGKNFVKKILKKDEE